MLTNRRLRAGIAGFVLVALAAAALAGRRPAMVHGRIAPAPAACARADDPTTRDAAPKPEEGTIESFRARFDGLPRQERLALVESMRCQATSEATEWLSELVRRYDDDPEIQTAAVTALALRAPEDVGLTDALIELVREGVSPRARAALMGPLRHRAGTEASFRFLESVLADSSQPEPLRLGAVFALDGAHPDRSAVLFRSIRAREEADAVRSAIDYVLAAGQERTLNSDQGCLARNGK